MNSKYFAIDITGDASIGINNWRYTLNNFKDVLLVAATAEHINKEDTAGNVTCGVKLSVDGVGFLRPVVLDEFECRDFYALKRAIEELKAREYQKQVRHAQAR